HGVLGRDGVCHHGRLAGRLTTDTRISTNSLRYLVRAPPAFARASRSASRRGLMPITGFTVQMRPVVLRAFGFAALWIMLSGGKPADLVAGVAATLAATWTSLRLLPPGRSRWRPVYLARLVLHFLRQSVVAGVDVAWRALDPRLPFTPGFVVYPVGLPPGPAR